jgi:hypothetical protein
MTMDIDKDDTTVVATQQQQHPLITVKTLTDRKILVSVIDGIDSIGDVRKVIADKEGAAVAAHRLVHKGAVLDDLVKLSLVFPDLATAGEEDPHKPTNILHLFYYEPAALAIDPIDIASDWDAKNRLKVFKGLYLASKKRDFYGAADLLTDALATFSETTLMDYKECVRYAVIAASLAFDRPVLYKKIIRSPEVLECVADIGPVHQLVSSLHNCQYADYFQALALLEQSLKSDWLLAPHTAYLVKELRLKAYKQLLAAYRSLKLDAMAAAFGVSIDFIDRELARFIAAGRLTCTINRVDGVVVSVPKDLKHEQYKLLVKEGDALFSRVQRLGRMVSY